MEVKYRILKIFVTRDRKVPFSEWLESLKDIRGKARIRIRLDRVKLGNLGDYKFVGSGVFELRIPYGPGYRVYYGEEGSHIILLLIGGDKSTQYKDIEQAKYYWLDYRSRKNEK
ncbi:MAG: type II toxin-antitoxin system RelE/ParE family toxin [Elusimicrobia bacterium]|nr:type II toxin-antitoxin system RelE/ParE family toxin [Elusimicrobiota bacterium]